MPPKNRIDHLMSCVVHKNVGDIASPYKGILLDAYGVFWAGNAVGEISGAKAAMENLIKNGHIVGILSNSTQPSSKEVSKIAKQGFLLGTHFHFYVTSGDVATHTFSQGKLPFPTPNKKFWVWGGEHPAYGFPGHLFQNSSFTQTEDLSEADFIYVSIPHRQGEDQLDPEVFREEVKRVAGHKLPMVCVNPDRFAHEGNPPKAVVRQGSIAAIYEEMGGNVFYMGKPHESAYLHAMEEFIKRGIQDVKEILMVGDTPETDIRGAKNIGMRSCLLVDTGIMAERIGKQGPQVLEKLSGSDRPDYFVRSLGGI